MKINSEALSRHLERSLSSLYLLHGNEPLLIEESVSEIRLAAKAKGFEESLSYDAQTLTLEDLSFIADHFSLFSEKKQITLHCGEKIRPEVITWILEYSLKASTYKDLCLVIVSPKLTLQQQKAKWVVAVEKAGVVIPLYDITLKDFPRFVDQRLLKHSLRITPEARQILIEHTEGNALALEQLMLKLSLSQTDQAIEAKTLLPLLAQSARYSLFDLVSQFCLGNRARGLKILSHLQHEEEPILVLWALSREIKLLLQLQEQKAHTPLSVLYRQFNIWDKRAAEIEAALKRLPSTQLASLLIACAEIDWVCKGLKEGDPWALLQRLFL